MTRVPGQRASVAAQKLLDALSEQTQAEAAQGASEASQTGGDSDFDRSFVNQPLQNRLPSRADDPFVSWSESTVATSAPPLVRVVLPGDRAREPMIASSEYVRVSKELARLRAGIEAYLAGDYPNPRTLAEGSNGKDCPHGYYRREDCAACDVEYFVQLLACESKQD